ncbi:hypothetical protein DH17_03535 [Acinetobacter oleivorans]|uniref:Uncharacterized protein n=1 Tax=Acinetobacter oleivorans TaxID=1148157 RepID=A0A0B2UA10_9GAMM|nr:hypothetical protein DH17_03535 [Acinetobacter oleivorans]
MLLIIQYHQIQYKKKFLDQYEKDRNSLNKQEVFLAPKVKPNWPCPISKEEQYRLVNLLQNDFLDQKITQKSSHNLKKNIWYTKFKKY